MDSDGENDELLERLPWGVWRCCDEAAPIYGKEHDRMPNNRAAHTPSLLRACSEQGWVCSAWQPRPCATQGCPWAREP